MGATSLAIKPHPPGREGREPLPRCAHCEYIVVGLPGGRCPECGSTIDWENAYDDAEQRRSGSHICYARGWAVIPATVRTLLQMLFRPIEFAQDLRWDEPIWPAAFVALAAVIPIASKIDPREIRSYVAGIVVCLLCNSFAFAAAGVSRSSHLRWLQRVRLFWIVSLYSTCFVAAWALVKPPLISGLTNAEFLWPSEQFTQQLNKLLIDWEFVGRSLIFYWWWWILSAFAIIRAPAMASRTIRSGAGNCGVFWN